MAHLAQQLLDFSQQLKGGRIKKQGLLFFRSSKYTSSQLLTHDSSGA